MPLTHTPRFIPWVPAPHNVKVHEWVPGKHPDTRMSLAGRPLWGLFERWHMSLIQRMQTVAEELPRLERLGCLASAVVFKFGLACAGCWGDWAWLWALYPDVLSLPRPPPPKFHTIPWYIWRFLPYAFLVGGMKGRAALLRICLQMPGPGCAVHVALQGRGGLEHPVGPGCRVFSR